MSVTDWWLGQPSINSATVVCRSNATATVTVGCNGQTFTGAADTAVADGVVAIPVTGLSADQSYAYTIDGVAAGTLKTAPSGDVWIAVGSCWEKTKQDTLAYILLDGFNLDLYLAPGDFPYCNTASTLFGETTLNVEAAMANGKDPANYAAHHRQQRRIPGMKELMRRFPFWYMADDHEYPYDNAQPLDVAGYAAKVVGAGSATQTDLDEAWTASRYAIEAYSTGFSRAVAADTDAIYGSYRINDHVEVFLIDCMNYRSNLTDADNASKTMLGPNQKPWLIAGVKASTATFKVVAMGKQFWKAGGNTDTWNAAGSNTGFETEKLEILYALKDVTGLLFVAGDQHLYSDQWVAADDLGAGYPAVSCLVGCPTTVALNASGIAGYETGVRSKVNGYPSTTSVKQDNVVGLLRITADRVYRYHLSTLRGLIPRGYIEAGSNQVQYPQMRFG